MKTLPKEKLTNLPRTPGVYFLRGARGVILYIGKAINLRKRVKNHFDRPSYWDKIFINNILKIGYIKTESDIEALLLESQLIKKYKPRYNIMLRDDKQYFYVVFSKDKLSILAITHHPKSTGSDPVDFAGPFTDGKSLKLVLRYLRKTFPYYTQKHRKLPCSYCHIYLCPGPKPNIKNYKKDIAKIRAILRGQKPRVISTLKKEMSEYSKAQEFERAAKARNQIEALENIFAHKGGGRVFDEKGDNGRVLPLPSDGFEGGFGTVSPATAGEQNRSSLGGDRWGAENDVRRQMAKPFQYSIKSIEAYDISNIQGREPVASMVRIENGKPNKNMYRKFRIRLPETPNDFAMMREVMRRRLAHIEWPYPDLFLIDGGVGQLNAALEELKKRGLKNAAGLAKRFNELYLPGKPRPTPMDSLPRDLKHNLMYARDEAHRFAISYHRKLHRRKYAI